jgi:hypothetical protein
MGHLVPFPCLQLIGAMTVFSTDQCRLGVPSATRVARQKPRRPQLVGISQVLRLSAGQGHQPRFGLGSDLWPFARPQTIVERLERTVGQGPAQYTAEPSDDAVPELGRPQRKRDLRGRPAIYRPFRRGSPVQFATARFNVSFATSASPIDNSITRRHAVMNFDRRSAYQRPGYRAMESA